ncbi:MAG TPA: RNA polymerase factor sigma-54, partial [Thermoanaerobaculia bacterium]|nr:RNA polymerase factor sigma-54 [Thermoanaerobaculia bacterium]
MALEQKLSLKLSQKLVMTPSLQQAIKLLQMTRLELEGALTQELIENPVLEEREDTPEETEAAAVADGATTEQPPAPEVAPPETAERERDPMDEIDIEAYFRDFWDSSSAPNTYEEREGSGLENRLTREPDLYDHLLWQLHMSDAPPALRETCELLIGNLDPDGFLVASFDEIRSMTDGNGAEPCTEEHVQQAIAFLQSFDPPGVGCRNLQECLLRQLEAREMGDPALPYRIVRDHWDLFLRRQFQALAKALDVTMRDLEPAVEIIRALDTHPGRKYSTERAHYVEPDVMIVKVGDEYIIQLNDDGLPRLQVSKRYRQLLHTWRAEKRQSEAQAFIKEKMRSAIWLIKSLDQRQRTLSKVAESIVRQQRDFLDRGIDHLKPMVLRDVAEDIGMHESTVSRVVSNKYIHTPRG